MVNVKFKKWLAARIVSMGIVCSAGVTAFAYTGEGTPTVQTKNGNTFFLVLDRSSSTENVYMLSMVDENDLAEFVPEKKPQTAPPSVVIPETEKKPEAEKPETDAEDEDLEFYNGPYINEDAEDAEETEE